MCECGCTMNDDRYTFPAPGKSFYLLTLSKACCECDAPSGVTIERIDPSNVLYKDYKRGDFTSGPLSFEKWTDSVGVAIITGMRTHEFIKATQSHLIGVSSHEMGEGGRIDECGAEVILEEMYQDAQVRPFLATPPTPTPNTRKETQ